tara:strand:- start:517 stop:1242 length:726 start_codon:yes stop_codon:yes gene_type:complete
MFDKLELASFGSQISGSGLGGSSSFLVALVSAISKIQLNNLTKDEIIQLAFDIEVNNVGAPIGGQDHYLSALGGGNLIHFENKKNIIHEKNTATKTAENLVSQCHVVFTGINRSATKVINNIKEENKEKNIKFITKIRSICEDYLNDDLHLGEIENLVNHVKESWILKKQLSSVSNPKIEDLEEFLERNSIEVLKLLGAGGGGYFLVRTSPEVDINKLAKENNFKYYKCEVDSQGLSTNIL